MRKADFDIVVIGASLSGALSAYLLARAGLQVLIIDPQSFPRQKACGEGLSEIGRSYLEATGLWNQELELNSHAFCGYDICLQNEKQLSIVSTDGQAQGYGISRVMLDSFVFETAVKLKNVSVVCDRAQSINYSKDACTIKTSSHGFVRAEEVVIACGAGHSSLMPELRYSQVRQQRYGLALWCQGNWQNGLASTVCINHQPEGQYIVTPLSDSSINLSVLLSRASTNNMSSKSIKEKACAIAEQRGFSVLSASNTRGANEIHSTRLKDSDCKAYIVGDAVERLDPIGGMGMTHAFYSAILAAYSILDRNSDSVSRRAKYYTLRDCGTKPLRMLTSLSYGLNVSNLRWSQSFVAMSPTLAQRAMSLIKDRMPAAHEIARLTSADEEHTRVISKQFFHQDFGAKENQS